MAVETLKEQIIKKAWAEPEFKQKLLTEPKQAIEKAFGIEFPEEIELKVAEETPILFYLSIPPKPEDVLKAESSAKAVW